MPLKTLKEEIIDKFNEEFSIKSKDGEIIPAMLDPDLKLKEKFAIFLLQCLDRQRDEIVKMCEEMMPEAEQMDLPTSALSLLIDKLKK